MVEILIWAALIPSIILIYLVLKQDRIESEPFGLLAKLFAFGAIICLPAGLLEGVGEAAIMGFTRDTELQTLLMYLVCVPLAEEGLKYLVLRLGTWKNDAFNFTFDAVVYAVIVSLGFATLENVLYVLNYMSLEVALMRGVMSVPLHCTCGVFMGYFYGMARNYHARNEKAMVALDKVLALAVPLLIHGLYDFALSVDSDAVSFGGLAFTAVVFILAVAQVRWSSKQDSYIVGTDVPVQQPVQFQQPVQYQQPAQQPYQQPVQSQQPTAQQPYQQPVQYQQPTAQQPYQQPVQYQQPAQPLPQQADLQQKPPSPLE